jgi:antitoxin component YwqK of YwqJK toxin-antitoxin module
MKITLIILNIITISTYSYSQQQKATILTELKTIQYKNGREVFNVCKSDQKLNYNEDLEYYWYNEFSKIKSSKGGAGGKLMHGKYQYFDGKGDLTQEANFYLGLKDGIQKTWDSVGKINETYKFIKGKLVYSKLKSEDSNKIIEWNGSILEPGSIKKIYTSYGHLESTEEELGDFKTKVTIFYYNGKIQKQFTHQIDDLFGEYVEFYENGKIKIYGKYDYNLRTGDWKWYRKDGSISSIEKYRINRQYYPNKQLMSLGGEYFNPDTNKWVKDGVWKWGREDGKGWKEIKEYKIGVEVEMIK